MALDIEFEWDEHNKRHLSRHGISRRDAEDVLSGDHILAEYQVEGSEERWTALGATRSGRILVIVFALRGEAVRPITGWEANRQSRELYLFRRG